MSIDGEEFLARLQTVSTCVHQAKRRTLAWINGVAVACCPKCFRRFGPAPARICWGCSYTRADLKRLGIVGGLRQREGHAYCSRCLAKFRAGGDPRSWRGP